MSPSFGGVIVELLTLAVGLLVAWFVINSAMLSALRQHHREIRSTSRPDDPTPPEFRTVPPRP
jgi:hypothetical protein